MKTEEDEAFDDLARKQGAWGGGFQAKRQAAMDKINSHFDAEYKKMHEDRAVYGTSWSKNGERIDPASVYLEEPAQEQEEDWGALAEKQLASIKRDTRANFEDAMVRATHKVMAEFEAQPAQEPVTHLWECLGRWSAYLVENGKQADCAPPSWLVDAINKATTPPLPEQEPVAQGSKEHLKIMMEHSAWDDRLELSDALANIDEFYATAPPKREWVGLTEKEAKSFISFYKMDIVRFVEAKLKEKNFD